MKKKILIIFLLILLCGCNSNLSEQKEKYISYIKELKEVNKTSKSYPFEIETVFDKLTNNEIRYQVIIDNVDEDIHDLEAIAIHNKQTDDVFPSIGIFDEKEELLKGKKPSGVILVGYIDYTGKVEDFKCNIKVLIKYKTKDEKIHKVYYVTKK